MSKRHEIYEQSKDVHVSAVMVYSTTSKVNDGSGNMRFYLTYDKPASSYTDGKVYVKESELKDLFIKGMLIQTSTGTVFKPLSYKNGNIYTDPDTSSYFAAKK